MSLNRTPTFPILLLLSIPLAVLACFTTTIAFGILLFRVTIVYIDLAIAVIPYYLQGGAKRILANPAPHHQTQTSSPSSPPLVRRKKRRGSSSSTLSAAGSIGYFPGPINRDDSYVLLSAPNSVLGLSASVGPGRDFEGVGGWRLDNPSDEDEALWTKINSRLELPANRGKGHKRSLTSGCVPRKGQETAVMMNTRKTRTPPTAPIVGGLGDGYFMPQTQNIPKHGRRTPSFGTASNESPASELRMKIR